MENPEIENDVAKKRKPILVWVTIAVVLIAVAAVAVTYVVLSNKPKADITAVASPAPKIPSNKEVGQIITSLDGKIDQAKADQASANAALNEAATPVKVDL